MKCSTEDFLDMDKPEPKPGELLCGGCWKLSGKDKAGWISYSFKFCETMTLCSDCDYKWGHDMKLKQKLGI